MWRGLHWVSAASAVTTRSPVVPSMWSTVVRTIMGQSLHAGDSAETQRLLTTRVVRPSIIWAPDALARFSDSPTSLAHLSEVDAALAEAEARYMVLLCVRLRHLFGAWKDADAYSVGGSVIGCLDAVLRLDEHYASLHYADSIQEPLWESKVVEHGSAWPLVCTSSDTSLDGVWTSGDFVAFLHLIRAFLRCQCPLVITPGAKAPAPQAQRFRALRTGILSRLTSVGAVYVAPSTGDTARPALGTDPSLRLARARTAAALSRAVRNDSTGVDGTGLRLRSTFNKLSLILLFVRMVELSKFGGPLRVARWVLHVTAVGSTTQGRRMLTSFDTTLVASLPPDLRTALLVRVWDGLTDNRTVQLPNFERACAMAVSVPDVLAVASPISDKVKVLLTVTPEGFANLPPSVPEPRAAAMLANVLRARCVAGQHADITPILAQVSQRVCACMQRVWKVTKRLLSADGSMIPEYAKQAKSFASIAQLYITKVLQVDQLLQLNLSFLHHHAIVPIAIELNAGRKLYEQLRRTAKQPSQGQLFEVWQRLRFMPQTTIGWLDQALLVAKDAIDRKVRSARSAGEDAIASMLPELKKCFLGAAA